MDARFRVYRIINAKKGACAISEQEISYTRRRVLIALGLILVFLGISLFYTSFEIISYTGILNGFYFLVPALLLFVLGLTLLVLSRRASKGDVRT